MPHRSDLVHYLDFSPAENRLYEETRIRTREVVNDAIENPQKGLYMNALQWLTQLRLICNHGTMHHQKMATAACARGSWSLSKAQEMFESMLDAGNAFCAMCSLNLADATLGDFSTNNTELPGPRLSKCLHLVCGSCLTEETGSTRCPICQPIAHCQGYKVSFTPTVSSTLSLTKALPTMSSMDTPTKVLALLASLKSFRLGEKRFDYLTELCYNG
jgi:SWI/SNF-related matrix-associated actin-dependent regulator of chromatin subfamily A3